MSPLERSVAKYLHDKECEWHLGDALCLGWAERHSWMGPREKRRLQLARREQLSREACSRARGVDIHREAT
jgi:hypothetical protein